jgi:hypothetical protein
MKRMSRGTEVQSILFRKDKWTVSAAKQWLEKHRYKVPAVDTTAEYHRFRQSPPFQFKAGTFRTIDLSARKGIKAVIAVPRLPTKPAKNPAKKPAAKPRARNPENRISRIPSTLADIATARAIELEDGTELRFPLSGGYALCATGSGDELWILSRKGGRRVRAQDDRAEKVFESFTGFEAEESGQLVMLPDLVLERIGRAKAIIYRSDKFSTKEHEYIHAFNKYPTVSVDSKTRPRIVALRGGQVRVKAEGITG